MLTNPCTTLCEINKFILLNLIIYSWIFLVLLF
jgi:hypothetical protein